MKKGKVKWFKKSYGFITDCESGKDYFVHFQNLQMEGFKELKKGQFVEFDIIQGPKGEQAGNVVLIQE